MTDSCAKREQNPHYGLYNGLRNLRARTGGRVPTFASNAKISSSHSEPKQEAGFRGRFEGRSITSGLPDMQTISEPAGLRVRAICRLMRCSKQLPAGAEEPRT